MEIPFLSRLLHGAGEGVSEWVCGLAEAKIPIFHLRIFPSWHSREWNGPQHCPGLGSPVGAGVQRVPQGWGAWQRWEGRRIKSLAAEREAEKGILRLPFSPYTENKVADS